MDPESPFFGLMSAASREPFFGGIRIKLAVESRVTAETGSQLTACTTKLLLEVGKDIPRDAQGHQFRHARNGWRFWRRSFRRSRGSRREGGLCRVT